MKNFNLKSMSIRRGLLLFCGFFLLSGFENCADVNFTDRHNLADKNQGLGGGAVLLPQPAGGLIGTPSYDSARSVALSPIDGSIYIAGTTNGDLSGKNAGGRDYVVAKLNSSGKVIKIVQGGTNDDEYARRVQVGSDGSVYVLGTTTGSFFKNGQPNTGLEFFVIKYDANLNQEWLEQYGAGPTVPGVQAYNMALDNKNGVLAVCGETNSDFDSQKRYNDKAINHFVSRITTSGSHIDTTIWGHDGYDGAFDCTFDSTGNLFVIGESSGAIPGSGQGYRGGAHDADLTKFDLNMNLVWQKSFGGAGDDQAYGIAINSKDDSIYVTGTTSSSSFMGVSFTNGYDGFLVKFDADGTMKWAKNFGTENTDMEFSVAVSDAIGGDETVYVAGYANLVSGSSKSDLAASKFDALGNELWTHNFPVENGSGRFHGTAVDHDGNLILTGEVIGNFLNFLPNGDYDMVLGKLSSKNGETL